MQAQHDRRSSTLPTCVEPPTAPQDLGGPSLLETPAGIPGAHHPSSGALTPKRLHNSQIHTQLGPLPRVPDSPHGIQRCQPQPERSPGHANGLKPHTALPHASSALRHLLPPSHQLGHFEFLSLLGSPVRTVPHESYKSPSHGGSLLTASPGSLPPFSLILPFYTVVP